MSRDFVMFLFEKKAMQILSPTSGSELVGISLDNGRAILCSTNSVEVLQCS